MKKSKKIAAKLFMLFVSMLTIGTIMSIPPMTASAAAVNMPIVSPVMLADSAPAPGGTGGGTGSTADSSFKTVIEFFVKWIGRVGGVIAFVGAIMFALAIKNNESDSKQNALLTMIAGFVAAAVAAASNMFNMFA